MLENILQALPAWFGLGTGAGAGFFMIKWFVEWLGGRVDKKEAAIEQSFQRLDAGTQQFIQHLQDQIASLNERLSAAVQRIDTLEGDLAECRDQHAVQRGEIARLQGIMQGKGEARDWAQTLLAAERVTDRRNGDDE